MKIFKINEHIEAVCDYDKTRNGFKHTATLFIDGIECNSTKICYLNRTWEAYEYQSVLLKLINNSSLSDDEKTFCKDWAEGDHTDWSNFKMVSNIAKLGEIFCTNQKDKNDWKERMLKAGLGNSGLEMPDDWDSLDEATKEERLNKVIAFAANPQGE